MPAEDQAGDMGSVPAGRATVDRPRHQGFASREVRAVEALVGEIDRPIQHGDADGRVAEGLGPELSDSGEQGHDWITAGCLSNVIRKWSHGL